MLMASGQRLAYVKVLQELLGLAGILAGYQRDFVTQNPQRPESDVFQVPYGSCYEIECTRQALQSVPSLLNGSKGLLVNY